jgi:hypothetical protein
MSTTSEYTAFPCRLRTGRVRAGTKIRTIAPHVRWRATVEFAQGGLCVFGTTRPQAIGGVIEVASRLCASAGRSA